MKAEWYFQKNGKCSQRKQLVLLAGFLFMLSGCRQEPVVFDSESGTSACEREAGMTDQGAQDGDQSGTQEPSKASEIFVYVCGEVQRPGVYKLPRDARIAAAVEAAGGMTDEAADTQLNLAQKAEDGQKIEVLSREALEAREEAEAEESSGLVNLNTAAKEELMTLTGIGESKAQDILRYREENGGFERVEELMQIPGIKEGVFRKIEDQITV